MLGDRTQAPSGAGYALENREILAQVLPDAYRELGVRRVRDVFDGLRERVLGTIDESGSPLAVILTPGPFNETYFEHAFLARQLGLPLVEGSDLTVRDTTVYLKTLGGLRRVHAILRRLDDDFCDPLELRGDSALGVAGLLARGARRPRDARQRARQRRAGVGGLARLPAGPVHAPARRVAAPALGGDLVVRRAAGAGVRAGQPRPAWSSSPPTRTSASSRCSATSSTRRRGSSWSSD